MFMIFLQLEKRTKVLLDQLLAGAMLMLLALVVSHSAAAQAGRIAGTVRDPHQAVVVGAKISAKSTATGKVLSAVTNGQGEFAINDVAAGEYSLTIEASGFKQAQLTGIKVSDSGDAVQNVALELAGSNYTVTVNELALDTDVQTQTQAALLDIPEGVDGDNIVFTAKAIEALHPASLLDVLQQAPGLAVSFQGRQHMDFASMRGGSFLVILDGVYMSQTDRILAMLPTQILGLEWLTNKLYPSQYPVDMTKEAQKFYSTFLGVELSDADAGEIVAQ